MTQREKRPGLICLAGLFALTLCVLSALYLFQRTTPCSAQAVDYYRHWESISYDDMEDDLALCPGFQGDRIPPGRKALGKQREAVIALYAKVKPLLDIPIYKYQVEEQAKVRLSQDNYIKAAQCRMAAARFFGCAAEYCIIEKDPEGAIGYLRKLRKILDFEVSSGDHNHLTWRIGFVELRAAQRICSTMKLTNHELHEIKATQSRSRDALRRASLNAAPEVANSYELLLNYFDCADIALAAALQAGKHGEFPTSITSLLPELSDCEEKPHELSRRFSITGDRELIRITSREEFQAEASGGKPVTPFFQIRIQSGTRP